MPIRSCGRRSTNRSMTSLAAASRSRVFPADERSSARMDVETSTSSTMSLTSARTRLSSRPLRGRASATTRKTKPRPKASGRSRCAVTAQVAGRRARVSPSLKVSEGLRRRHERRNASTGARASRSRSQGYWKLMSRGPAARRRRWPPPCPSRGGTVPCELDQVALLQERPHQLLVGGREQPGARRLPDELLGRPLGRLQPEPLLEVAPDDRRELAVVGFDPLARDRLRGAQGGQGAAAPPPAARPRPARARPASPPAAGARRRAPRKTAREQQQERPAARPAQRPSGAGQRTRPLAPRIGVSSPARNDLARSVASGKGVPPRAVPPCAVNPISPVPTRCSPTSNEVSEHDERRSVPPPLERGGLPLAVGDDDRLPLLELRQLHDAPGGVLDDHRQARRVPDADHGRLERRGDRERPGRGRGGDSRASRPRPAPPGASSRAGTLRRCARSSHPQPSLPELEELDELALVRLAGEDLDGVAAGGLQGREQTAGAGRPTPRRAPAGPPGWRCPGGGAPRTRRRSSRRGRPPATRAPAGRR